MTALAVYREYLGSFQLVGEFWQPGQQGDYAGLLFSYDSDYLRSPEAKPLSISLPLSQLPMSRKEYGGFFEGLIPEDQMRTQLAFRYRLNPSDYIGILSRLNLECAGALAFLAPGSAIADFPPGYRSLRADELEHACDQPIARGSDLMAQGTAA